jgi:hypothetical protein
VTVSCQLYNGATAVGEAFTARIARASELTAGRFEYGAQTTHILTAPASAAIVAGYWVTADSRRYLCQREIDLPDAFGAGQQRWELQREGSG